MLSGFDSGNAPIAWRGSGGSLGDTEGDGIVDDDGVATTATQFEENKVSTETLILGLRRR